MKTTTDPRLSLLRFAAAGSIVVSIAAGLLFWRYADLVPVIDGNFFFSTDDPHFQDEIAARRTFPSKAQVILVAGSPTTISDAHLANVEQISRSLEAIPGVDGVLSLTRGPKDITDALESPLWRRALISNDRRASNLIVNIRGDENDRTVAEVIRVKERFDRDDFDLSLSGVPFVVHEIKRQMVAELQRFSAIAFGVFGVLILLIFRSIALVFGSLVSCLTTCCLTFLLLRLFGVESGILTANLWAISFVVTLSHIVFITANWERELARGTPRPLDGIRSAVRLTGPASFWAMVTTMLGFLSLLLGAAKPLRQLGLAGAVGTTTAIFVAYVLYPPFLAWASPARGRGWDALRNTVLAVISKPHNRMRVVLPVALILLAPAIFLLDSDPSLFCYFKDGSPLREDLERIDRAGGSSPLEIAVRDRHGQKFTTDKAFERLWVLQEKLEGQPQVGVVMSLPVLMAEADRHPLSFFLSWENLIRRMEDPKHDRIARGFISRDRTQGRFMLRMRESDRTENRGNVIDRLEGIVRNEGFEPTLTTGLYRLQGQLSGLVMGNLVQGLAGLVVVFFAIALFVTRSWRTASCMIASLLLVPAGVFGIAGYCRMPVDILSAPATNIALGIGVDGMIHLVSRVREYTPRGAPGRDAWTCAIEALFKPIAISTLVVAAGFSTFLLSNFPPTQRLGLLVSSAVILALFALLFVLPELERAVVAPAKKGSREP